MTTKQTETPLLALQHNIRCAVSYDNSNPFLATAIEDIDLAVNQHSALVAVAEAASLLYAQLRRYGSALGTDQCQQHWDTDTDAACDAAKIALAQLAAVRNS